MKLHSKWACASGMLLLGLVAPTLSRAEVVSGNQSASAAVALQQLSVNEVLSGLSGATLIARDASTPLLLQGNRILPLFRSSGFFTNSFRSPYWQVQYTQQAFYLPYVVSAAASVPFSSPTPVPLPATGWLLIASLGGLLAARSQKRKATAIT